MSCRCSAEPQENVVSRSTEDASGCTRGALQLTFASSGAAALPGDRELDPVVDMPFSAEPGTAVAVGDRFWATGLRHEARGAVALLGRIGLDSEAVELVELGRVQGDVAPPRLAVDGNDVVVALQRATAGGHDVQVGRLPVGALGAPLAWAAAPHQTRDESNAFDLAAHGGRAVIVWDDWFSAANHGRVVASTISLDGSEPSKAETFAMSGPRVDAEAPRLTSRPGGYWLAWLVNPSTRTGASRVYDPGGADDTATASYGRRWIEVVPLDGEGRRVGEARQLTPREERVVGYDLTSGAEGSAWIVWRQDAPSPGASGGRIFMAELRTDGTEDVVVLREDDIGAGEPSFLPAGAGSSPWLTFPDAQDRTLLMRLDRPRARGPLRIGNDMAGAAALAAAGPRLLFAQPRGRAIELFPAFCRLAEAPPGVLVSDAGSGPRPASVMLDASPGLLVPQRR